jgi:hypothetical protein
MTNLKRIMLVFLSVLLMAASLTASNVTADSLANQVPEFTLDYVDNSYDVPPTTTSSTNPYTNETTTTTISGYHVENKTVIATIKNNIGASYYNFRYKGHYAEKWRYYPSDPDSPSKYNHYNSYRVPYQASNSSYTVISLHFLPEIPEGEIDIQMQALFGGYRAVHYGNILLPEPTYDFYFEGTTSEWSPTQTITIGEGAQTETPTPNTSPSTTAPASPSSTAQQTATATSTEPSKEVAAKNTALFGLNWVEVGILVVLTVIVVLLAVSLIRRSGKGGNH